MIRTDKMTALRNLRAAYPGMSDYQHAFILASDARHRFGEVGFGNSPGSNAVHIARRASLIVALAKLVPADQTEKVRALATKYVAMARSARLTAMRKDARGYAAAATCYRENLSHFWPKGCVG